MRKRIHPRQMRLPFDCITFDGPPTKWRTVAIERTWIELAVEQQPMSWPTPGCGTPMCINVKHLTWEYPKKLLYPEGICVYCGMEADTRDHLLPRTWTGDAVRRQVLTVPACRECNSVISDHFLTSIVDRRKFAHERLGIKHRRLLNMPEWAPQDVDKLGKGLRSTVERGIFDRKVVRRRLAWPTDQDYDLRAMQHSGIANPQQIGLL